MKGGRGVQGKEWQDLKCVVVCGCLVELGGRGRQHRHLAKLRDRLEERGERGQPHGRLTDVHGGLAELERRGQ